MYLAKLGHFKIPFPKDNSNPQCNVRLSFQPPVLLFQRLNLDHF
jgi:hypothetical protein